ncbi:hypothetical protein D1816_23480 [Aquimarina sp. AD10]|uniref:hypothetical protein n=1 Tax=Aquimarina TaxID=290174 RepID=UPI000E554D94|nr:MULTISPECIES: hypothetical protein [Aquimarina]AXT63181.1 hypothetical protein D1816_23480 [Aquimarina sp. AD10]RKM98604.1 hypothetical protein D7033_11730 [Aquimarina sp. AD10]
MKNRVIAFLSIVLVSSTFLISCQEDDNDQNPTGPVTTSQQFKDIEAATNEINSMVESTFGSQSGLLPTARNNNKINDCATISNEVIEDIRTVVIDFGDGCEVNGETISGIIRMSFDVKLNADNKVEISYGLENFKYKDITVSGTATTTFTFRTESTNTTFSTSSDFSFTWDEGLTATNKSNFNNEIVIESSTDAPEGSQYYTLTSGSSTTEFSNGDIYTVEINTPLRKEIGCNYIVSGVVTTTQNDDTTTLNYGDGECDNKATQTDKDGNETVIEL